MKVWLVYTLIQLFTFIGLSAQSAVLLTGKVIEQNKKGVDAAIVMAYKNQDPGTMIGYAITNSNGEFSIQLLDEQDSIRLTVSHLSYSAIQKTFALNGNSVTLVLEEKNNVLDEIVVKAERFKRKGDTLIFDVSQIKKIQDETIEDVIRRIPGIEISSSGQIIFEGLPINKFYIEGMDMLEGNYTLASKRLQANLIDEIQILERHQPIRALTTFERPLNAAINLKLKVQIAFVHRTNADLGYSELPVYGVDHSSFAFRKKTQAALIGGVNNIGITTNSLLQDHFRINYDRHSLNASQINPPNLEAGFYLDNQDEAVTFNSLFKVSDDAQIKVQLGGNHALNQIQGDKVRSWEVADLLFLDTIKSIEDAWKLKPQLIYEKNSEANYSKWQFNYTGRIGQTKGDHIINSSKVIEDLAKKSTEVILKNESVLKVNNRAWRINSSLQYLDDSEAMQLNPSQFIDLQRQAFTFKSTNQELQNNGWKASTSTNLYMKINKLVIRVPVGIQGQYQFFSSSLSATQNNEFRSLGTDYENKQELARLEPYINPGIKLMLDNWEVDVTIPISYIVSQTSFRGESQQNTKSGLGGKINLSARRSFIPGHEFSFQYRYSNVFELSDFIYRAYVLSSFQSLQRNELFNIYRIDANTADVSYSYKDFLNGTLLSFGLSGLVQKFPLVTNYELDVLGVLRQLSNDKNIAKSLGIRVNLSQELFGRSILFKQNLAANRTNQFSQFSGETRLLNYDLFTSLSSLEFSTKKWSNSIKASFQFSDNSVGNINTLFTGEYGIFIQLSSNTGFSMDYIINDGTSLAQPLHFLNAQLKYKLKGRFGELKCRFNNITNTSYAVSIIRNDNYFEQNQYRLRPRQLLFSYTYNW